MSVHENTDGNGWRKLAEVTDGDSYEFTITEDFAIKYIRVSQQTADGMIESEPFIVAASEDGYVCTWLDSDNDGLPDYAEKIYGTDPENADTDGDGLSDYDEIYKTGTNPLKYDTDEDGVNDADSDNDKDGLTNSEELALGTDPNSADTDDDGLSDYDEINNLGAYPVSQPGCPSLLIYGSNDGVLDRGKLQTGLSYPNAAGLEIPGGNHAGFGCYGKQSGDGESDITAGEQWDITEKAIREFVDNN